MKKILILLFLLVMAFQSFSQNTKNPVSKEDYLAKSKKQQKIGLIMLVGGPALAFGGIAVWANSDINTFGEDIGFVMFLAGSAATVASLPLLIISRNNKDKAEELSFGITPVFLPKHASGGPKSFPALKLSIPL